MSFYSGASKRAHKVAAAANCNIDQTNQESITMSHIDRNVRVHKLMLKIVEAFDQLHRRNPQKLLSMLSDDFTTSECRIL